MTRKTMGRLTIFIGTFTAIICLLRINTESMIYTRTIRLPEDQSNSLSGRTRHYWLPQSTAVSQKYIFNCTNIKQIQIIKRGIGRGRSKAVDIGMFNGEKLVIKKIANSKQPNIKHEYRQLLFLKEILLRDQINHTGLINMLGYCVRSIEHNSYKEFSYHGDMMAVYEYGEEFNASNLFFSVEDRLKHSLELAELFLYLKSSPLGSLLIGDYKHEHFLMVKGKIKLIDLDFMHDIEYPCQYPAGKCPFDLKCRERELETVIGKCENKTSCSNGECTGSNSKFNMDTGNKIFFKNFLQPKFFPTPLRRSLGKLLSKLEKYTVETEDLVKELNTLIQNYERLKAK